MHSQSKQKPTFWQARIRSPESQRLHAIILDEINGKAKAKADEAELIELIQNKNVLRELSNNNKSHLCDVISFCGNTKKRKTRNLKVQSEICHKLLKLMFQYGDAATLVKLFLTKDYQGLLPLQDVFNLEGYCWKECFAFISRIGDPGKCKEVATQQFIHRNDEGFCLFRAALFSGTEDSVKNFFDAIEYCLQNKLIFADNLTEIFSADLVMVTIKPKILEMCLSRMLHLAHNYKWDPKVSLTARNQLGFNFLHSLIANYRNANTELQKNVLEESVPRVLSLLNKASEFIFKDKADNIIQILLTDQTHTGHTILHHSIDHFFDVILDFLTQHIALFSLTQLRILLTAHTQDGNTCLDLLAMKHDSADSLLKLENFIYDNLGDEHREVWGLLLQSENLPENPHPDVKEFLDYERKMYLVVDSSSEEEDSLRVRI